MQRIIWTAVAAFAVSLAIGPFIVKWLRKMKMGGKEYDLGPQSHLAKQGTPIMGGIIFFGTMVVLPVIMHAPGYTWRFVPETIVCILGFGAIGFTDDYIKIKLKRHEGLSPKQKLLPQIVLSIVLAVWSYNTAGSRLIVPFTGAEWDLGFLYIPVMAFILVAVVNSANLLDGCDGLLAGCSILDFAAFIPILGVLGLDGGDNLMLTAAASAGALMAFLCFNTYPAKVFMGDSGSFAIGGSIAAIAMCSGLSLILPIMCLAMMLSSLSDIIQITYFKITHGKRIFRMAPLQHHFELSGMPETQVVNMYRIATAILCLMTVAGFLK
ncbi:MAG: phospho-N-acetylmuramoyl-pentapeptide-transferase [Clostridia bacterium]|nr:phospho-N-acetylmuramoyl-pentapeptide-transferase [Clostridia bacterium]